MTEGRTDPIEHLIHGTSSRGLYNSGYSRFVRRTRLVLPVLALAIIGLMFTWHTTRVQKILPQEPQGNKIAGKNELVNPHFENVDDQGQPYTVSAKRAVQDKNDPDLLHLEKPAGDIKLKDGHWLAIQAEGGMFQRMQHTLALAGGVTLFRDGGYQMQMARLNLDIAAKTAHSPDIVHGEGPAGTIDATGLDGSSDEGILIFNGPAKLVLNTNSLKDVMKIAPSMLPGPEGKNTP